MNRKKPHLCQALFGTLLSLGVAAIPLASHPVYAQSPSHVYELNSSVSDSRGGPALNPGSAIVTSTGLAFTPDPAISLTGGFATSDTYSIEMYFWLNVVRNSQKILDFKDRASNRGLYVRESYLEFTGVQGGGAPGLIPADTMTHLILSRDGASQRVNVFVNGNTAPILSFTDSNKDATLTGQNSIVHFFTEDTVFSNINSAGFVDYIRTYDTALTGAQVADVYSANVLGVTVPESSSLALVGSAASLTAGAMLYRCRKRA